MKTCPDCGCRVYKLGCVNCNEAAYIEQQAQLDGPAGEVSAAEDARLDMSHAETDRCSAESTGTFATRDELDRVLCWHGRPFTCGECGEEYARELMRPSTSSIYRQELELAADTFRDFSNVLRLIRHDTMSAAAAIAERHIRETLAKESL